MLSPASGRRFILALLILTFQCATAFGAASSKISRRYLVDFGFGYFSNLNSRTMTTTFGGGYVWGIDPEMDLILAVDVGYSFEHSDVRFLVPQGKARYSFDPDAKSTWYVGGGLGFGYGANHQSPGFGSESVTGVAASGAFGYKAYQKNTTSVVLELEHIMILRESVYGTPILTCFKVGVLF